MLVAYSLVHNPSQSPRLRRIGWAWGALTLLYALAMSVGRAMEYSHWIADGTLTIVMNWMTLHALFFWVLRVPDQSALVRSCGPPPDLPRFWEVVFCFYLLWAVAGGMLVVIGIRAVEHRTVPWELSFVVPGVWLIRISVPRCARTFRRALGVYPWEALAERGENGDPDR
jgi:hypothetical protein